MEVPLHGIVDSINPWSHQSFLMTAYNKMQILREINQIR